MAKWFIEGGRPPDEPYGLLSLPQIRPRRAALELTVLAAFCEVWLAREGHDGLVGINLLTKIQLPTLPTLYGAILAGVDCVLMGAGIPREIPAALDGLARHAPVSLRLDLAGDAGKEPPQLTFDPGALWDVLPAERPRPQFLPIVSSTLLATVMARKASRPIDGLIIEGPRAGGHNAPPRGEPTFNADGEPIYGERDEVDLDKVARLGLPFWLAGGAGHPEALSAARAAGAAGIQVGTLFAFCDESGIDDALKRAVLSGVREGTVQVRTDPRASPTGYPFKVVELADPPSAPSTRTRLCDLGYLRVAYRRPDGRIGFRCPGEPEDLYVAKGGDREDTVGRQCLCNALLAVIGHGQVRPGGTLEAPIVTAGDDLTALETFLAGRERYTAGDVLDWLLPAT